LKKLKVLDVNLKKQIEKKATVDIQRVRGRFKVVVVEKIAV